MKNQVMQVLCDFDFGPTGLALGGPGGVLFVDLYDRCCE